MLVVQLIKNKDKDGDTKNRICSPDRIPAVNITAKTNIARNCTNNLNNLRLSNFLSYLSVFL